MNKQCYLIHVKTRGPMLKNGQRVPLFTHSNKGKVYPYSSGRQNTREARKANRRLFGRSK